MILCWSANYLDICDCLNIKLYFGAFGQSYLKILLRLKTLYFAYCISEMVGRFDWVVLALTILSDATEC
jgi:hypothetical protein